MLFNKDKSFIQRITENEIKEFAKSAELDIDPAENPFIDANTLYQVKSTSQALKNLLNTSWNIATNINFSGICGETVLAYFNDVTSSIIKVPGKMNFNEALILLNETIPLMGQNFAGAILVKGKELINPFHPLTALCALDNENYSKSAQYSVVVYSYKNREALDKKYHTDKADPIKIEQNLNDLILTFTSKSEKRLIKVEKSIIEGTKVAQSYRISKEEGENLDKEFFISTHQVLTRGIVAPYYGTSIITMNGSTQGIHCSPQQSVNISGHDNRTEGAGAQNRSVCTGSLNNQTLNGLRSLTHANLSSPYNRQAFHYGALAYADACIKKSLDMYRLAKILPEKENVSLEPEEEPTSTTTDNIANS